MCWFVQLWIVSILGPRCIDALYFVLQARSVTAERATKISSLPGSLRLQRVCGRKRMTTRRLPIFRVSETRVHLADNGAIVPVLVPLV